jgi:hypothetical protein
MVKPWKSFDPYLRKCVWTFIQIFVCHSTSCTLSTTSLSYSCFICNRKDLHFAHNTAHLM